MQFVAYGLFALAAVLVVWGVVSLVTAEDGFIVCMIFAVFASLGGVGALHSYQASNVPHLSSTEACSTVKAHPMPVSATLYTTRDTRYGYVYPCMYLMDMGFQPGRPADLLGHLNESVFNESQFRASSSWGGVLILGTGGAGGSSTAKGSTVQHDVYAFMAKTTSGTYTKFVVDSDSVQLATCGKCHPTVTMSVDNNRMFLKKADNQNSIWVHFRKKFSSPGVMLQSLARVVITLPVALTPRPVS